MNKKHQTKDDLRTRLAELSGWHTATRDDAGVAHELYETHTMDRIHSLNEAAFFDEFFHYLQEIGVWSLLEDLDPQDRRRPIYPFIQFALVTIMRCVGGVQSMLATHDLLLTDPAIMEVIGFNAAQVEQGSCDRGLDRCTRPKEIRGALSYETIADNIVKIGLDKLEKMFNGAIRCLAEHGCFSKKVAVVLDTTDDEATPNYNTDNNEEVPHVTKEKRPDIRFNKHAQKIKVTVYGWKIWLVYEPESKIPLAMKIDGINVTDNTHAFEVLKQASANLAGHSIIHSVALDRGFLDGKLLSKIEKELGIIIYIPAKSNLDIASEARGIARRAEELALQGKKLEGTTYATKIDKVRRGSGKNASIEKQTTTVVRIRDLPCDWWTQEGATSAQNSKDFKPKLVNATVILCWEGASKDEEKEVVILDTDPSSNAFAGFHAYDDRSLIENTLNREAKESWFLEHHPKCSEAGMRVHAYFVFMCMALIAAFREYQRANEEAELRGEDTGIGRYRRKLELANRGKLVVFCGNRFGIFKNYEVMLLVGVQVKESALRGHTAKSVLARYPLIPPNTS